MLVNVIFVPQLKINLLLVRQMTNAGIDVTFNKDHSMLSVNNAPLTCGTRLNSLFTFETITSTPHCKQIKYSSEMTEATLWHHQLGHVSYMTIQKMLKVGTVTRLPSNIPIDPMNNILTAHMGSRSGAHSGERRSFRWTLVI